LLAASQAPALCGSEPSRSIIGRSGVKANRPMPIATANATAAIVQAAVMDSAGSCARMSSSGLMP
jgi:hypothetical protein